MVRSRDGRYLVERWIASSTPVGWSPAGSDQGLSLLAGFRPALKLRDALKWLPDVLLGPARAASHDAEFRVLTKILDAYDPIGFHFHQTDDYVRAHPGDCPNERFGKDEAYYFLPGPRGACPYTHVGLSPDVTMPDLLAAMATGREALLDVSPHFLQQPGMGFFVPAGLVHSPGTMLTLEVQQSSDVGAGFSLTRHEVSSGDKIPPSAWKLFDQIDLELCRAARSSATVQPPAAEDHRGTIGPGAVVDHAARHYA